MSGQSRVKKALRTIRVWRCNSVSQKSEQFDNK